MEFNIENETNDKNEVEFNLEESEELKEEKQQLLQDFISKIHEKIEIEKSKITLVVDRFEGDIAVCENRENEEMQNINLSELPENIKEGDVIKYNNNKYEIDEELTAEIKERINNKFKNLFED